MSCTDPFTSWLAEHFEKFVALKRATGFQYTTQRLLLIRFDRFLQAEGSVPPLRRNELNGYLVSRASLTPRARDNVISVVWSALEHAQRHGAPIEPLPHRPPAAPGSWRKRPPRIVTPSEVERLLLTARKLVSPSVLRPATLATLIGLLYVTGLRIGETLALDVGHFDRSAGILTVHRGKFGKSRALPICRSTANALVDYIEHPLRPIAAHQTAPIFVSSRRRRIAHVTIGPALKTLCRKAGLLMPWPTPHDFRHSFAVGRVLTWYHQGQDFQTMLPALSTYLGHACVENTRLYLVQNGALLEQASQRFGHFTEVLDEECP